jgi:hypothetical protein
VTGNVELAGGLDTSQIATCTGGVITQPGNAPEICVVRAHTITVDNVTAPPSLLSQNRVLALVADGDLHVAGTLDVSARGTTPGPGGDFVRSPAQQGSANGGAGMFTNGGGGTASGGVAVSGPFATMSGGANAATVILRSGNIIIDDTPGGAGGGGLILVSCRGTVDVTGTIGAGGGGGSGGHDSGTGIVVDGSGGGSGGYVVIQGASVSITGSIFANGGAGGGGCDLGTCGGQIGLPGQDGQLSLVPAAGGLAINGGGGGNGGTLNPPGNGDSTSGGGGAAGRIQIYTPAGVTPSIAHAGVSPAFDPSLVVSTR